MQESKVSVEKLSNLERKIIIEVPAEKVDSKFKDFFDNVKKDIQLPGFRKGKVPFSIMRQRFEETARKSIAEVIINEEYVSAASTFDFIPVGNPRSEKTSTQEYFGSFNADNTFTVSLIVDVLPKIDPVGYTGMGLVLPRYDEGQAVNAKLSEYSKTFATHEEITTGAVFGDSVIIDFAGALDGRLFEGGSSESHAIDSLGTGNFIPGFEDGLVGMSVGQVKSIPLKFPDNYHAVHLAGKDVVFDVKMQSVVRNTPAFINDDMALMMGANDLDDLIEKTKVVVKKEYEDAKNAIVEHQIAKTLSDVNHFEVPQILINGEIERLIKQHGQQSPQVMDILTQTAVANVKAAVIINAIYDKEKSIELTKEEFDVELNKYAAGVNKDGKEVLELLYKTNQVENFINSIKKNRVINFVLLNATISYN